MTTAAATQKVKKVRATNVTFKNTFWLYGTDRQNLNNNLNDYALDYPISNFIYDSEKHILNFMRGHHSLYTKKLTLITAFLNSNGVTTSVYEDPLTGVAFLHQKHSGGGTFAITYIDLVTLANDAFGSWNFNKNAFPAPVACKFDQALGTSNFISDIYKVLCGRKAPQISTITKGLFDSKCNFKYNEFLRNQPSAAAKLGHEKANRKILKYWQADAPDATFCIYTTGSVLHPIKLAHHESHKIKSETSNHFCVVDFFVLKSVDQDYYTLFCPNSYAITEDNYYDIGNQTKFHGIYPSFDKANSEDPIRKMIQVNIDKHQELLNKIKN